MCHKLPGSFKQTRLGLDNYYQDNSLCVGSLLIKCMRRSVENWELLVLMKQRTVEPQCRMTHIQIPASFFSVIANLHQQLHRGTKSNLSVPKPVSNLFDLRGMLECFYVWFWLLLRGGKKEPPAAFKQWHGRVNLAVVSYIISTNPVGGERNNWSQLKVAFA